MRLISNQVSLVKGSYAKDTGSVGNTVAEVGPETARNRGRQKTVLRIRLLAECSVQYSAHLVDLRDALLA